MNPVPKSSRPLVLVVTSLLTIVLSGHTKASAPRDSPTLLERADGSFLNEHHALISHLPALASDEVVTWRRADGAWVSVRPAGLSVRHADGSVSELERPAAVWAKPDGPDAIAYRGIYRGVAERYRRENGRLRHELVIDSMPSVNPDDVLVFSWDVEASGNPGAAVLVTEVPLASVDTGSTAIDSVLASLVELLPKLGDAPAGDDCAEQEAKLTASDAEALDLFGRSVSISGDTVLVGTRNEDSSGMSSGATYVFVRSGPSWTQQAKLTAADAEAGDQFGQSVALFGDTAVIGADLEDEAASNTGAAYVFVRSGISWTQQAKLIASDAAPADQFGFSASLSGDTAVIGAPFQNAVEPNDGAVYVFVRSGTTWTQQAKLTASDGQLSDHFGISVSISGDTVVIGADREDAGGFEAGAAYVFARTGTSWAQQAKLTAADAQAGDQFGETAAISGDTIVIGALGEDTAASNAGAAYVFVRTGTSWTQQQKLTASDAASGDVFGSSLSVSGDTTVVGARNEDAPGFDSGAAYAFVRSGTSWDERAKLTASDAAGGDQFGWSASTSADTAVIGAYRATTTEDQAGAAYVFDLAACLNTPPACDAGPDVDAECDGVTLADATAEDPDGDDLTHSWTSDCEAIFSPGPDVLNATVTLGGSCGPTCTLTLSVDDGNGGTCEDNVVVNVDDQTPPQLDAPPSLTVQCNDSADPSATGQAIANDECSVPAVSFSDIVVPGGCPGTSAIMRTWTAVDDCMNETSDLQMITVADTTPPVIDLGVLPLDPLPPTPPLPACAAPNSRMVEIQCGAFDTCSAATVTAVLRVTQTVVPLLSECTEVVDLIPVECGDAYELRLTVPACPDVPRSAAHPVVVHPDDPLPIVTGDSIVLEVTAVDECGNVTTASLDPAVEPSPNCEQVTQDGTCCPMIARPPAPPSCLSQPCEGQVSLDPLEVGDAPPVDSNDRRLRGIRGRSWLP